MIRGGQDLESWGGPMDNSRVLYNQCCNCRYANRGRGGNPLGCLLQGPGIGESTGVCSDYTFWWSQPPRSEWLKNAALVVGGIILLLGGLTVTLVTLGVVGLVKVFRFALGGLKINKDNLGLYFPKWKK